MALSLHEYGTVGHKFLHQWHQHSLPPSHHWLDVWGNFNIQILVPSAHQTPPEDSTMDLIRIINHFPFICTFWHVLWVGRIVVIGQNNMHCQTNLILTQYCQICKLHYFIRHLLHLRCLHAFLQGTITEEYVPSTLCDDLTPFIKRV